MAADTPSWGPKDKHRLLNTRLQRVDGPFKATGTAQYTYDAKAPGLLYGRILTSPYARARVTSLDLAPALKIPGVRAAVAAGAELRFEGDPVAAVAADTAELADSAVHAIVVKYQVLPFVINADQAMKPGAPEVYPGDPQVHNNVREMERRGDPAAVEAALAKCDVVVQAEYQSPVIHHACLETHGVTVDYRGGPTATVYSSTQNCSGIAGESSRDLGLPQSAITGEVQNMGGGFGSKFSLGAEGRLGCQLSKMASRPVKLMLLRTNEFLMAGNGGAARQIFKAGANRDGTAVAMHVQQYGMGGLGRLRLAQQPYIYRFQQVYRYAASVHTNTDGARALRAPGHPPASFAIESLMDELADKLGMDPIAFRKKNLSDPAHFRQLDRGAKEIGWERRKAVAGSWPGTLKRGFGCGCGDWGGGGHSGNQVELRINRDAAVFVQCGTQDLGTGTRTYMRAIVAEELGLDMPDVQEEIGDSRLGYGSASGGSTTAASLSPVVKSAAFKARLQMAQRLAPLLNATPDQVVFDNRSVSAGAKSLSWKQACAALTDAGLVVQGQYDRDLASSRTHGVSFAEVEVDVETGHVQPIRMVHVQDCGLPLNRLAVESQINGGMVQAIGMALLEGRVDDPALGVMVNPSFMDYKLPGVMEMPEMIPIIDDGDERNAVIGVGEPPAVPPAAAIANAVYNACGVRVRDLPITPDKILMGLQARQA
jgi:xanthine dehydrogenase YagR molybdenum-binding subunit